MSYVPQPAVVATQSGKNGNGVDGAGHIAVNTTLVQDMNYTSLLIDPGVTLNVGGYRIFHMATLTNNGTIDNSGHDAVLDVAGAATTQGTMWNGSVGGAGAIGAGANGGQSGSGINGFSGAGGAGGAGASGGGGLGGTSPAATAKVGLFTTTPQRTTGVLSSGTLIDDVPAGRGAIIGGAGGGAGCGDGANKGGGGGGGAGLVLISGKDCVNNGVISAKGGKGGNGVGAVGTGGGGGGGGGTIIGTWQTLSGAGTFVVTGGAGGVHAGAAGVDGSPGLPGTVSTESGIA
jgi:hypothetical protein